MLLKPTQSSMIDMFMHHKAEEPSSPTASTMTFQGTGCADHLCQKKDCDNCEDDRFRPLLEFEFVDMFDSSIYAKLCKLGWAPEKGSPADYFDEDGDSLLHSAARLGDTRLMKALLEVGAQANACCQGESCCCTPLMAACRWCQPGCVRLLVEHGADVNLENHRGETALELVRKAIGTKHDRGQILSLLHKAVVAGIDGLGDHLCQQKACDEDDRVRPQFVDMFDSDIYAKLCELGWDPEKGSPADYFDEDGDSLLHWAARQGDTRLTKALLEMGAQANACCQGECCCTPLMVACRWCQPGCACLLVQYGADVNLENARGETAIDLAAIAMGTEDDRNEVLALF